MADFKTAILANRRFHFGIYKAAGTPTLLRMIEALWLRTGAYANLIYPGLGLAGKGIENHDRIAPRSNTKSGIRPSTSKTRVAPSGPRRYALETKIAACYNK